MSNKFSLLKTSFEKDPEVLKIIQVRRKDWFNSLNLRTRVAKLVNSRVRDTIDKNTHAKSILLKKKDGSLIQKNYPKINQITYKRWWEKEIVKIPTKHEILLVFLFPDNDSWDIDEIYKDIPLNHDEDDIGKRTKLYQLKGFYNVFNQDISRENTFQVSNLEIIPEIGIGKLKYLRSSSSVNIQTIEVQLKILDENILFLFIDQRPFFSIAAYLGNKSHHEVIQGILVAHDISNLPYSTLIILEKVDKEKLIKPVRQTAEIHKSISRFLFKNSSIHRIKNANDLTIKDLYTESDSAFLKQYVGTWSIYCNIGPKNSKRPPDIDYRHIYIGNIAENILEISHNENNDVYTGIFKSEYFSRSLYGSLRSDQKNGFLIINLSNDLENEEVCLFLYKGVGTDDNLMGVFVSMYPYTPILSVGTIIAQRSVKSNNPTPRIISLSNHGEILKDYNSHILNFLSNRESTRIEPPIDYYSNILSIEKYLNFIWMGVYKVFSYGLRGDDSTRCISVSVLLIDSFRGVKLKSKTGNSSPEIAWGYAYNEDDHFIIHLKNQRNGRWGCFVVDTDNMRPEINKSSNKSATTVYSGVFAGFTRRNKRAVANRILLEYVSAEPKDFDEYSPKKIDLYSSEYNDISSPIKDALTGMYGNMIGFLRSGVITKLSHLESENKEAINFAFLFYDSACHRALLKDPDESLRMIERAVNHGFNDLLRFEEQLEKWITEGLLIPEEVDSIIRAPTYLKIKKFLHEL